MTGMAGMSRITRMSLHGWVDWNDKDNWDD